MVSVMPSARDRGRQVLVYFGLADVEGNESPQPDTPSTPRDRIGTGVFQGVVFGVLMTIFTDNTAKDGVVLALMYALLVIGATLAYDRYSRHDRQGPDARDHDKS